MEERDYYDSAIIHFDEIMRWENDQTLEAWGEKLLNECVHFTKGFQAALYRASNQDQLVYFIAGYAAKNDPNLPDHIPFGEGLIGEAARSQEIMYVENVDDKYFAPHLPDFDIKPAAILILPLIFNQRTRGVLEINSLKPFEKKHIELFRRLSENMGAHLNALVKDAQLQESLLEISRSEERLRRFAEVTIEGTAMIKNGLISESNTAFNTMFGYSETEVIKLPVERLFINENKQQLLIDAAERPVETIGIRKDGSVFPIEIRDRDVDYKGIILQVVSFFDISQRKEHEATINEQEKKIQETQDIVNLYAIIEKKNKDILASINYARRIQKAILPDSDSISHIFPESFILYLPKDVVSGDFYWFAQSQNRTFIAVVDCTGHGVPGAFMSLIGYLTLERIVKDEQISQPAQVIAKLDEYVTQLLHQDTDAANRDTMDMALCVFEKGKNYMDFAAAKRPLFMVREKEILHTKGSIFPVGGSFQYHQRKTYETTRINLQKDDMIYLTSDGYADQTNPLNQKITTRYLKQFILEIADQPADIQKEFFYQQFIKWKGSKHQVDDIIIIGIRWE